MSDEKEFQKLWTKKIRLEDRKKARQEFLLELTEIAEQLEEIEKLMWNQVGGITVKREKQDIPDAEEETVHLNAEMETKDAEQEDEQDIFINRKANKVIIGIAGTQARIGCTHTGILLAGYLRKQGFKVAFLEYGRKDAIGCIEPYLMKKIDLYENITAEMLMRILAESFYNFLIVDFGTYADCDRMMFNRSDIKLLIAGAKPWELAHIHQIFETTEPETLRQITFGFNFAPDEQKKAIQKEMAELGKIYFVPMQTNPFEAQEIGELQDLFQEFQQETENTWKTRIREVIRIGKT